MVRLLHEIAAQFIAPYAKVSDDFLREMAKGDNGTVTHVSGAVFDCHIARIILAFRSSLAALDALPKTRRTTK